MNIKRWYNDDCVLGRLSINEFHFFTLELPWLENRGNVSCIPAGTYEYFARKSHKNGNVLELRGVEDRKYIQIHAGNYTSQILGCILVGDGIKYLNNDSIPDITNSKNTLKKVLQLAGSEGHIIIGD